MIYFTADTHFYHANIINICKRPFENVEQMNLALIQNWNSCVNYDDEIYILGDFMFKDGVKANNLLQRLNGKKYLVRGNHDRFIEEETFIQNNFEWIKDYYVLNYQRTKIVLFHYPIVEWDGYFKDAIHLHGHVHNCMRNADQKKRVSVLGKKAVNVGVDVNDFKPVSIEKILKMTE